MVNCSFKGRHHLRLDTFIGENWKDNKALQREFVDGILRGDGLCKKRGFGKIEQLCRNTLSNSKDTCSSDNSDADYIDEPPEPEEEWNKPSPARPKKKKGKYLSPSQTKLNDNPIQKKA